MRFRYPGAALVAAALVSMLSVPAFAADNYVVRDGLGNAQTFCSKLISAVQYPCHMLYGLFGGTAVPVAVDGAGNLGTFPKFADATPISNTAGLGNLVSLSGATVAGGDLTFTANAQTAVIDTQGFASLSFQVSGFGTGALQFAWSDKPTTGFVAGAIRTVGNTGSAADTTSVSANGQYLANGGGRYLQISTTAFTTGPFVVTPVLHGAHIPARSVFATLAPYGASGVTPVTCTITTATTCGPLTPVAGRDFHVSHKLTGFTGSCQWEVQTDGTNWYAKTVTAGGSTTQMFNWAFSASTQNISEDLSESQFGVPQRLNCTAVSAGSDVVTISQ